LGIGYWGVYDGLLQRLGPRFLQRVFVHKDGPSQAAPAVGSAPHALTLKFGNSLKSGVVTFPRDRSINGEALPHPFVAWMGPVQLPIGPVDAAIAVTNRYGDGARDPVWRSIGSSRDGVNKASMPMKHRNRPRHAG